MATRFIYNCSNGKTTTEEYPDLIVEIPPTPQTEAAQLKAALIKKGVLTEADVAVQTG